MTIERRLAHSGVPLTRNYPAARERGCDAFAVEERKLERFGTGEAFEPGEWAFYFRVGGRDVAEGKFHDGPASRFVATYTDIIDHVRIVNTYDMWLDGVHKSTSVASFKFEPTGTGTRLTQVVHGIFLAQFWAGGPNREAGSRGVLETLGNYLA